jgi:hypothetical protein
VNATIDYLAASAYRDGADAVTVAVDRIALIAETWDRVGCARSVDPQAFPGPMWADLSLEAVACKVVGALLNAGWTPPGPDTIAAAVADLGSARDGRNGGAQ